MWGKIAGAVAAVVVTAYVGRKAYVANRDRKQETADLEKKAEGLDAQLTEIAQKTKELEEGVTKLDNELEGLDREVVRLSAELKSLDARTSEGLKNIDTKLDGLVEMLKAPVAEAPVAEAPVAEAPVAEAPVAEAPAAEAANTNAEITPELVEELLAPKNKGARKVRQQAA
jgi:predicted nuclease with TOPRIM domain